MKNALAITENKEKLVSYMNANSVVFNVKFETIEHFAFEFSGGVPVALQLMGRGAAAVW